MDEGLEQFEAWLRGKPEYAFVGVSRAPRSCPVAQWIVESRGVAQASVHRRGVWVRVGGADQAWHPLTVGVELLMVAEVIDHRVPYRQKVSAAAALHAVQVVKATMWQKGAAHV